MLNSKLVLTGCLILSTVLVLLLLFTPARASQNDFNGPSGSGAFGTQVIVLPNGNIVVTDPNYGEGGVANIGAVYLYDGATLALISTLKGSTANDRIGQSITILPTGKFVVSSPNWNNGAASFAGAVTLCDATLGCSGTISAANSLVGSSPSDFLGSIIALPNGNYLVRSPDWDNPAPLTRDVGAVTFCNGTAGCTGAITAGNSLIGSRFANRVGSGLLILADGDYVANSPEWDTNGGTGFNGSDVGAVTFCSGTMGCAGVVSASNSLVGDKVGHASGGGSNGVVPLSNGNYVVIASLYFGPTAVPNNPNPFGAVIFCNGITGCTGAVASNTSLVGSANAQSVGGNGVTPLPNGNYVVNSPRWDNGGLSDVGAVTFCNGTTGCSGFIDASNSLIGSTLLDTVGNAAIPSQFGPQFLDPITVLPNGNYVVGSPAWDNGSKVDVGAVTLCNGTTGCVGSITPVNSLIGSTTNDTVGQSSFARVGGYRSFGVFSLSNNNYVVNSPFWNNGTTADAGAVTFCNGSTNSCAGQLISAANSLIGSKASDLVGSDGSIALANGCATGNYVVASSGWDNGTVTDVGAITVCNGETGCTGVVSPANSLIGSTRNDLTANVVTALPSGGFVLASTRWDNGAAIDAGAVTFCSSGGSCVGPIGPLNSLIGSRASDQVGNSGVTGLANGNYLVASPNWDDGATTDVGAITFCNGATGCSGSVSSANSLVGSKASDQVGASGFLSNFTKLPNGNYILQNPNWDNGATANAGAVTFGDGTNGTTGIITATNSVLGTVANAGVFSTAYDAARNRLFVGRGAANTVSVLFFETTAIADGNLSDIATWSGIVPNALTNVIIPAGRTVSIDIPASMGNLSLPTGASLTMNANLSLTGNLTIGTQLNTGPNKLSLSCSTRVEGASATNYVIGNVEKYFCATDAFLYPTGTASGYSPVEVAVTGLCQIPSSLSVRTNQGSRPGMDPAQSAQRYWTLTENGDLTANLLFKYLDDDVVGNEAAYQLFKWEADQGTPVPSVVDTVANTVSANGISHFSDWTIGNALGNNTAPTLTNPGDQTTAEGSAVSLALQAFDANGDTLTFTATGLPSGLVISPATGTISGTLDFNSAGTHPVVITVSDGSSSSTASFNWVIDNVNRQPVADSTTVATGEDTAIQLNLVASDADGDTLTFDVTVDPAHGTVVLVGNVATYTPALNYNGPDTFTYTISDGHGGTATATATVTVSAINDAPVAFDGAVSLAEDTPIEITLTAADVDNAFLSFALMAQSTNGILLPISNNKLLYTPDPNFNGVDVFTFIANDGTADSNIATFSITVTPVADSPVLATVGNRVISEGALLSFDLSASDPDADLLTFSASGLPSGAILDPVTGAFSWTPESDQAGKYTMTVIVTDSTNRTAAETITITVSDVVSNLGPICSAAYPSANEIWPPDHHAELISLLGVTDPDNDSLTIRIHRILQDEPTNTYGDGNTWIDGGGLGTSQVWVRAERSGTKKGPGNGRIYEIFFEASDGRGKSCTGSVKVGVPHDEGKGPAIDDGRRYDSTVASGACLNCKQ